MTKWLLMLGFVLFMRVFDAMASNFGNAYEVLGVPRTASQEDIRRRYRELCLQYHPDKNTRCSSTERKKAENRFKEVQEAFSQIGDEQNRRLHDLRSSSLFHTTRGRSHPKTQEFFRGHPPHQNEFAYGPYGNYHDRNLGGFPNWYSMFTDDIFSSDRAKYPLWSSSLKSTYLQKVSVALPELYQGKKRLEITLRHNLLQRYMAAFRGGIAYFLLYQSLLFALPLVRIDRWISLLFGLFIFHRQLPRPTNLKYTVNIRPGYKGGTKFTFQDHSNPAIEVVFVLEEEKHFQYRREGKDLHVDCLISPGQAQTGCTIQINHLDRMQPKLNVMVQPRQIVKTGDSIVLPGEGWPSRRPDGPKGDLVVHFTMAETREREPLKQ